MSRGVGDKEGRLSAGASTHDGRDEAASKEPDVDIRTVGDLLGDQRLEIPDYQRPYKWTTQHVGQLWADLAQFKAAPSYRLGTVVLHRNREGKREIVDGQQRLVTLLLMVKALLERQKTESKDDYCHDAELASELDRLAEDGFRPDFRETVSRHTRYNVWNNYNLIERRLFQPGADSDLFVFMLKRCSFVVVTLADISEAFQFFDSQNSRGKDLQPHDLLKAYHLRQFGTDDRKIKIKTVNRWENTAEEELADLFNTYLYRIRCWCRGNKAQSFSKDDMQYFKGVDLSNKRAYPMTMPLQMAHTLTELYNTDPVSTVDGRALEFPHQLDQTIINGQRFFEWVSHYQAMGFHARQSQVREKPAHNGPDMLDGVRLGETARKILELLDSYRGRHRVGDRYVRSMFDCLIMYYMDKFGNEELSAVIEKAFIWAYSLRLAQRAVQQASMNRHVVEGQNVFRLLRDAVRPREFLDLALPRVKIGKEELAKGLAQGYGSKEKSVFDWFDQMQYVSRVK